MAGRRVHLIQQVRQVRHQRRVRLPDPRPALVEDVPVGRDGDVDPLAMRLAGEPVYPPWEVTAGERDRLARYGHGVVASGWVLTPLFRVRFGGQ